MKDRVRLREFLAQLRSQRIQIWSQGEQLHCRGPKESLTPQMKDRLQEFKPELLAFLANGASEPSGLVALQAAGGRPPLFAIPGHTADSFAWVRLARHLGPDQPFYSLEPPALGTVQQLAARCLSEVRPVQPQGPYRLLGFCWGGVVAFEMAQQLVARGEGVDLLGLVETPGPSSYSWVGRLETWSRIRWWRLKTHRTALGSMAWRARLDYVGQAWGRLLRSLESKLRGLRGPRVPAPPEPGLNLEPVRLYQPGFYPGKLVYYFASPLSRRKHLVRQLEWLQYAREVEVESLGPDECNHGDILSEPYVQALAERLRGRLERDP